MSNKNTISGNTIIIKNAKIEISNTYLGFPQTYLLVEKMRRPNIWLMKELKELKDYHQTPVMEQLRKRKRHLEQDPVTSALDVSASSSSSSFLQL
jgi:hypothetical protein